jgi:glycosyltransferase involved in cell wall biosynthesis
MISIIIPFYNTGESCAQLVKQLLNDKQRDIEIICVDDSSTDDSLKIVNTICKKDKRAKTVHQEKNQGSAAARNRGLEEATGDYVVFLDSDDDVAELFLTKMLEGILTENSVLAVCGIRQNYLHTGKIVDKFTTPASEQKDNETWEEYILRLMIEDAHLYSCVNKIYKRKFIKAGKVHFDTELDFAEDTKFVLDYLKQAGKEKDAHIEFIPDPLYTYNYGTPTSVVSESSLIWDNWQKNYEDIVNWAGSRSEKTQKYLKKLRLRFKISHALAVARSKKSFRKKCHYENPFVLICAKVIVALRG